VTRVLADLREKLAPFYSDIGRSSIDPELMIRMLIVGYCYGIRFERRLCQEVELHLAYRWFCRLDLDDKIPDHSTFSVNRHGRFRDSDILRHVFEAVVRACMDAGLVKGEGFVVDASVMEADASRYHGKAPDERRRGDRLAARGAAVRADAADRRADAQRRGRSGVSGSHDGIRAGARAIGLADGRNVRIVTRWGVADADRIRKYAAELAALAPDVILAHSRAAIASLLQATRTVPIVFTTVADQPRA
jgi:transposase